MRATLKQREPQCAARVETPTVSYRCQRDGTVERSGRWYCDEHAPPTPRKETTRERD